MLFKSTYFWTPSQFSVIKKYQNHLIAVGVFIALSIAYFSPALSGKVLTSHDVVQSQAMAKEIKDIYKEEIGWSDGLAACLEECLQTKFGRCSHPTFSATFSMVCDRFSLGR